VICCPHPPSTNLRACVWLLRVQGGDPGAWGKADKATMARRKVIKVRRSGAGSAEPGAAAAASANPFSGATVPTAANPFAKAPLLAQTTQVRKHCTGGGSRAPPPAAADRRQRVWRDDSSYDLRRDAPPVGARRQCLNAAPHLLLMQCTWQRLGVALEPPHEKRLIHCTRQQRHTTPATRPRSA
jgi:hypothetical protein